MLHKGRLLAHQGGFAMLLPCETQTCLEWNERTHSLTKSSISLCLTCIFKCNVMSCNENDCLFSHVLLCQNPTWIRKCSKNSEAQSWCRPTQHYHAILTIKVTEKKRHWQNATPQKWSQTSNTFMIKPKRVMRIDTDLVSAVTVLWHGMDIWCNKFCRPRSPQQQRKHYQTYICQ